MNNHAGWFVDDENIGILIDQLKWQVLRLPGHRFWLGHLEANCFPTQYPFSPMGNPSEHSYPPLPDPQLQLRTRVRRKY
jgi:hypothetical protein